MERKRLIIIIAGLLSFADIVQAESFEQVRAMSVKQQVTIPDGVSITGIVVSDFNSFNAELNPNLSYNKVDLSLSHRTVYIESPDGHFGFRVVFDSMYGNRLTRGMNVTLDLSDCILTKVGSPRSYTISALSFNRVKINETNTCIPLKRRRISELTDEDIYTFTTITDVEFMVKQGCFSNIYESCAQASSLNVCNPPFRVADGWASLLEDGEGRHLYMQLNSKCLWRRNDFRFPKGIGDVSGVIVCNQNRRYGCNFGPYSIRPFFREDISISTPQNSHFNKIVEWNWNFNTHQAIRFKRTGELRWVPRSGVKDDAVLPDIGVGELWTDSGCAMSLDGEYDSRFCAIANGAARTTASALRIDGKTEKWYPIGGPAAIYIKTSTKGITGKGLIFNFSFVAGNESYYKSWGCPAFWTVEYSTDGKSYKPTGFEARLRPLAFPSCVISKKGFIGTPYDAAMGFSEYSVNLPASLLDQDVLFVRLIPKNNLVVTIDADPSLPVDNSGRASDNNNDFCLRLGMVGLKVY